MGFVIKLGPHSLAGLCLTVALSAYTCTFADLARIEELTQGEGFKVQKVRAPIAAHQHKSNPANLGDLLDTPLEGFEFVRLRYCLAA